MELVKAALDRFNMSAVARDTYKSSRYAVNVAQRMRNARYRAHGAPDGLPLPPAHLVYLVSGQHDLAEFCRIGVRGAESIRAMLAQHGLDIARFGHVLDFGCGCGRIMRQWHAISGPAFYGSDYNPLLLNWCRDNLPFATFSLNDETDGLRYPDATFDFAYAISVFTHLNEQAQGYWLRELRRSLTPGGYLLITTHGSTRVGELPPNARARYAAGEMVVLRQQHSGDNVCKVFHPEQAVRRAAAAHGFSVVAAIPGGARDANQDGYLLRRDDASDGGASNQA